MQLPGIYTASATHWRLNESKPRRDRNFAQKGNCAHEIPKIVLSCWATRFSAASLAPQSASIAQIPTFHALPTYMLPILAFFWANSGFVDFECLSIPPTPSNHSPNQTLTMFASTSCSSMASTPRQQPIGDSTSQNQGEIETSLKKEILVTKFPK